MSFRTTGLRQGVARGGVTALAAATLLASTSVVVALVAALTLPAVASALPVPDHLKCYKIKDPAPHASYTADLGDLVAEPGCLIRVPAIMACVPATKTNVTPTPPGGGGTGTPNAFGCYKIKCPRATLPAFPLNDQFGSRSVTPKTPSLLCAPVGPPTTTTTTMPPPSVCCSLSLPTIGQVCGYTHTVAECPGTPGVGLACDGTTGACVQPPGPAGPCCQCAGAVCTAGPFVSLDVCNFTCGGSSGTLTSARCTPSGCVP